MNTLKIIDRRNVDELQIIGESMAEAYQRAFAGSPWFEASRCEADFCDIGFCPDDPGGNCPKCASILVEAYDKTTLVKDWETMVREDDALIELTATDQQLALRATIARPTNPDELLARKYENLPEMQPWADANLPDKLVWIEDTFANLRISPQGNLVDRARTLGLIATRYAVPMIATRTLAPAVVRATLRDAGMQTDMYLGSEAVGVDMTANARYTGELPDRRTFLAIDTGELRV
jgi:hypothetical protein